MNDRQPAIVPGAYVVTISATRRKRHIVHNVTVVGSVAAYCSKHLLPHEFVAVPRDESPLCKLCVIAFERNHRG